MKEIHCYTTLQWELQFPLTLTRIIKEYYEQFYAHKFDILDEMDQFPERHKLPKKTTRRHIQSK